MSDTVPFESPAQNYRAKSKQIKDRFTLVNKMRESSVESPTNVGRNTASQQSRHAAIASPNVGSLGRAS